MSNFIEFITQEQKYLMQRPLKPSMATYGWFFHSNVVQANRIGTNTANHVYHVCSSSIINRAGLVQLSVVFQFPRFAHASTFPCRLSEYVSHLFFILSSTTSIFSWKSLATSPLVFKYPQSCEWQKQIANITLVEVRKVDVYQIICFNSFNIPEKIVKVM